MTTSRLFFSCGFLCKVSLCSVKSHTLYRSVFKIAFSLYKVYFFLFCQEHLSTGQVCDTSLLSRTQCRQLTSGSEKTFLNRGPKIYAGKQTLHTKKFPAGYTVKVVFFLCILAHSIDLVTDESLAPGLWLIDDKLNINS